MSIYDKYYKSHEVINEDTVSSNVMDVQIQYAELRLARIRARASSMEEVVHNLVNNHILFQVLKDNSAPQTNGYQIPILVHRAVVPLQPHASPYYANKRDGFIDIPDNHMGLRDLSPVEVNTLMDGLRMLQIVEQSPVVNKLINKLEKEVRFNSTGELIL